MKQFKITYTIEMGVILGESLYPNQSDVSVDVVRACEEKNCSDPNLALIMGDWIVDHIHESLLYGRAKMSVKEVEEV